MEEDKLHYSKNEQMVNCRKIDEFKQVLENSSISETDRRTIEYMAKYFQGTHDPMISSRIFLFHGYPGIGKTFFVEKLLKTFKVEILYMANTNFPFTRSTRCKSFKEIIEKSDNNQKQVLFFDDLDCFFEKNDGELSPKDQRYFMQILELVKRNPNKLMIVTSNDLSDFRLEIWDRIEVPIHFDLPTEYNKIKFLEAHFKNYLSKRQRTFIAKSSIGYNYRDLLELIKLAYRLNGGNITMQSLKDALKNYCPSRLGGFDVLHVVDITLKDVIGKQKALAVAKRLVHQYKNDIFVKKLGVKRNNLLLFHGPPGTGKTFMAKAIAG